MTGPVTTEALVNQIARILDPDAHHLGLPDYYGPEPILAGASARVRVARKNAGAILAGPLAPLLAAHQQVTAERDEARAENDRFRAGLANGSGPCVYCDLSREDWSKCRSGFPGCGRADDAMLCPHFGAEMEAKDRADTAEAELARLRAEGEDLRAALRFVKAWIDTDLPAGTSRAGTVHRAITKALDRTALARAATTREGA